MEHHALRHSAAHVLASAVKELFPGAKLAIGPAIEDGFYYDFDFRPFTPEDLEKIEKRFKEIIKKNLPFIKSNKTKKDAEKILKNEPYKLELLKKLKEGEITFYSHGDFTDLCAGPHVKSTGEIKGFKLLRTSGAYWLGDSKNKQLQRIYGTAFPSEKELQEYIKKLEEAEKRNHIKLGKQLKLFTFEPESPGSVFYLPRGTIVYNELIGFLRNEYRKRGYQEIKTPILYNNSLWKTSGHWEHYKNNMFFTEIEGQVYALKPMNCPACMLAYKNELHSYKELPIRYADFGILHRNELSGVLNGMFRLRYFVQDDAHIFIEESQIEEEVWRLIDFIEYIYKKVFVFDYSVKLSTRPEKFLGDKKTWDYAEKALENALKKKKVAYTINEGDGTFYGPKIDFHINDSLGRSWQLSTIQLDYGMPLRFELTYEGKDGRKHRPVVIHRAIFGSLERFMAILIEHTGGVFPLWLAPVQVILLTVGEKNFDYAREILLELEERGIRVELDDRAESIGRKVRDAQLMKINYIVTIGDKEQEKKTLAIRTLDGKVNFGVKVNDFVKELIKKIDDKV